ncbi:MAG: septal ring lytic transglycosylase RlpA family protein [Methylobacterium organophilum]|nr:septal ring lytic transglycosylase RlpA family protein [Methylobacterium organophilum]
MLLRFPARAALACLVLAGSAPCALAETASWYGPGFHGRRAADGSRFDQDALTAAHKTLPFGTRVRVTCAATGRSVVVRITDRGPFIAGRAIDLSRGAAQAIGLTGIGRVHLAILG